MQGIPPYASWSADVLSIATHSSRSADTRCNSTDPRHCICERGRARKRAREKGRVREAARENGGEGEMHLKVCMQLSDSYITHLDSGWSICFPALLPFTSLISRRYCCCLEPDMAPSRATELGELERSRSEFKEVGLAVLIT